MYRECHAHIILDGASYKDAVALHREGPDENDIRKKLSSYRDAGVTFIRDGGDKAGVSLAAKRIAPEYGIRYLSPAFAVYRKGLYGSILGKSFETMSDIEDRVREASRAGADFIKVMASGILDFSVYGKVEPGPLEEKYLRYIVSCAGAEGMSVMVHVNGDDNIRRAVDSGAASIEHGFYMRSETLSCFQGEDAPVWVPTLSACEDLKKDPSFDTPVLGQIAWSHRELISGAFRRGINIAAGSDCGAYSVVHPLGIREEYERLVSAGGEGAEELIERGSSLIGKRFERGGSK